MNILYFIGNGFDINIGMLTRYINFYEYYMSIKSPSDLVKKLKAGIKGDIRGDFKNWSDLESALGKYTRNLKSTKEFDEIFIDIQDNLANYLEKEEEKFDYNSLDVSKLYKHLTFPEDLLPEADKRKLKTLHSKRNLEQWNIQIITFNYTKSLEKITNYKGNPISIGNYVGRSNVHLRNIEHIHGYTNERMVLGVNDISQISNNNFHTNEEVIETLVKSECNKAQKHMVDDWCKNQIANANLICIFGSSLGDTDNIWWEYIGERIKWNCNLIIFERGEEVPPRRLQKLKIIERRTKNYFLNKTNLTEKEKEEVKDKIFIGINTEMFNLKFEKNYKKKTLQA